MTNQTRAPESADVILRRAFAPWHKRTLGLAVGLTAAIVVAGLTVAQLLVAPEMPTRLILLNQYFYGYDITWPGVVAGAWWAFVAGFVAGWFVAFLVNLFLATWLLVVKAKADLSQTTDFLDHI
jgi:hypothetical protein